MANLLRASMNSAHAPNWNRHRHDGVMRSIAGRGSIAARRTALGFSAAHRLAGGFPPACDSRRPNAGTCGHAEPSASSDVWPTSQGHPLQDGVAEPHLSSLTECQAAAHACRGKVGPVAAHFIKARAMPKIKSRACGFHAGEGA